MSPQLLAITRSLSLLVSGIILGTNQVSEAQQGSVRFYCGNHKGEPATKVSTSRRLVALIVWRSNDFEQSGYNPQRRCIEVSRRFQENFNDGYLKYVVAGVYQGSQVLCSSRYPTKEVINCPSERILMTLRTDDDASFMINRIYQLNTGTSSEPINNSAPILIKDDSERPIGLNLGSLFEYSEDTDSSEVLDESPFMPSPIPN